MGEKKNWKELFGPYGIIFKTYSDGSFEVKGKVSHLSLIDPAFRQLAVTLRNEINIETIIKKRNSMKKNMEKKSCRVS